MLSDRYKQQLLREVKQLDQLVVKENYFEKLAKEITEDKKSLSSLELLKSLGDTSRQYPSAKMTKIQEKISELLFMYIGSENIESQIEILKKDTAVSFSDLSTQLNDLIGLNNVKQQVQNLIGYNKIQQLREEHGLKKSNKTLHMAFLGNPGTAKTTVARIVGRMYKEMGLLSKGHFIEASRTDLIAEYQGQTAIKVKRLISRAKGGVLFIDEAYSITENNNTDSYGKESLTELTKALEDYREDLVVIVAGYTDLMNNFFDSNPGLKSRFNTFISFDDYSLEELVRIFAYMCAKNDYTLGKDTLNSVENYLKNQLENENKNFANGRSVRNLFDDVTMNQAKRLFALNNGLTKEMLSLLLPQDIPVLVKVEKEPDSLAIE